MEIKVYIQISCNKSMYKIKNDNDKDNNDNVLIFL